MTTEVFEWMLAELLANSLSVAKIRKDRGYVRAAVSQNAPWYQQLCRLYCRPRGRWRKHRTVIRRCTTVKALKRMIKGDTSGVYAQRILEVASDVSNGG